MKTRAFNPGLNAPILHLTREGSTVKVYTDNGKTFMNHSIHNFGTVSAAKAFFASPRL